MVFHRGRFLSFLLVALLAAGALMACDDDDDADEEATEEEEAEVAEGEEVDFDPEDLPFYATGPVAKIDGEEISADDFNAMVHERVEQMPGQLPPQMVQIFRDQIYDFAIDKYLIDQVLEDEDIEVTEEDVEEAFAEFTERFGGEEALEQQLAARGIDPDEVREDMHQDVMLEKYLEARYDLEVTEEDMKEFFEMHKDRMDTQEQRHARHVLIEVDQQAEDAEEQEALERATAVYEEAVGGADFEELAREHSEGPTGPRGGDLGFFPRHQMVPEFSEVAFGMEPGDISEPVRTQFGFHVIQLVDIQEGGEANFDDVRSDIEMQLKHQKRQEVFQEFLEAIKEGVAIERLEENIVMNVGEGGGAQPQGMPAMPQPQGQPQGQPPGGGAPEIDLERPELELNLGD